LGSVLTNDGRCTFFILFISNQIEMKYNLEANLLT
jgi:hypothetical protein